MENSQWGLFAPSCGSWIGLDPSLQEDALVNLCFLRWEMETKRLLDVFLGGLETGSKLESWLVGTDAGCQRMFALSMSTPCQLCPLPATSQSPMSHGAKLLFGTCQVWVLFSA